MNAFPTQPPHEGIATAPVVNDMDDREFLSQPGLPSGLVRALGWLEEQLGPDYREADRIALARQKSHRRLAQACISAGTVSILLAIVQLALLQLFKPLGFAAMIAEAVVMAFAGAAVVFGLIARHNHDWLVQRHRAERLRSLKFEALGQPELAGGQWAEWEAWVLERRQQILAIQSLDNVVEWASSLPVEPPNPASATAAGEDRFGFHLATYYLTRRVEYQSAYFRRRQVECHAEAGHWPHRGVLFFFGSVACVLVHVVIDGWLFVNHDANGGHSILHGAAIVLLALAAILPVVGFGIRAWFTAFELPRSASLFGSKARALTGVSLSLRNGPQDLPSTRRHIAFTEHFLQHEHGEWIRLLRETEWFL